MGYFVFGFVLPTLAGLLATDATWFRDLQPWVDFNRAQGALFNGEVAAEDWAHLAVTSGLWILLPVAVGLVLVMRSEVK